MTFSYDQGNDDDVSRIRFRLNDVVDGVGVRPNGTNFTDEELEDLIVFEGSWQRALAAAFETLSSAWRLHPTYQADGVTISNSHIPRGYADEAKKWRDLYGYPATDYGKTAGIVAVEPTKLDGFYYEYNGITET